MISTLGSRTNFLSTRCYIVNCRNRFSEPTTGSNGLINCPVRTDVNLVLDWYKFQLQDERQFGDKLFKELYSLQWQS